MFFFVKHAVQGVSCPASSSMFPFFRIQQIIKLKSSKEFWFLFSIFLFLRISPKIRQNVHIYSSNRNCSSFTIWNNTLASPFTSPFLNYYKLLPTASWSNSLFYLFFYSLVLFLTFLSLEERKKYVLFW